VKKICICFLFIQIFLISCATTVKYDVKHQPLVDIRNKSITVIPLSWENTGEYDYLDDDLTNGLIIGIQRIKKIHFIHPSTLANIDVSDYWKFVDICLHAEILNVTTHETTREDAFETNGKKKTNITRTATIDVKYDYIRTVDGAILARSKKTVSSSITYEKELEYKTWLDFALNLAYTVPEQKNRTFEQIAKNAADSIKNVIAYDFIFYTTREKRKIIEMSYRYQNFKKPEKLVRQKKYSEALTLYKNIYEQTNNVNAGYNAVLLLQAEGQFEEALKLSEEIKENILKNRLNSNFNIDEEIEKIKMIIFTAVEYN